MDEAGSRSLESRLNVIAGLGRLARSLLRDASLADDVLQEASLAALRHDEAQKDSPRYWSAVVRNLAAKLLRARARSSRRERAVAVSEVQPSADAVAARLALHHALLAAIEDLPALLRDVVVRRWLDGEKPQHIARELGVPVATVKTRMQRGLARLRERLDSQWKEGAVAALLSIAHPGLGPVALVAPIMGAWFMATKSKVLLVGIAVLALAAWGTRSRWWIADEDVSIESPSSHAATLDAEPRGGASVPALDRVLVPEDAPPPEPPIDPRRFCDLVGIVLGLDGVPFAGARVEIRRRVGGDLPMHPSLGLALPEHVEARVTGGDGRFRFRDQHRGTSFVVTASADPDLLGSTGHGVQAGDDVVLKLGRAATLRGVVRRIDGSTVSSAIVTTRTVGGSNDRRVQRTTTNEFGRFAFERLPRDPIEVTAFTREGHFPVPRRVELRGDAPIEVELEVGSKSVLDLLFVDDASSAPLAGAQIFEGHYESTEPIGESDASGRLRVHFASTWPYSTGPLLFARASGYSLRDVHVPAPSERPQLFEVRLAPGGAIRGCIVDGAGSAVEGAVIAVLGGQNLSRPGRMTISNESALTRSGSDGEFALVGVDARIDRLVIVRHEGFATAELEVRGGATSTDKLDVGDVVLRRGAIVCGRVTNEHGEPIPQARVHLAPASPDAEPDVKQRIRSQYFRFARERETFSRKDGGFAFDGVPQGSWVASARLHGRSGRASRPIDVDENEDPEDVEVLLVESMAIEGFVVDEEGNRIGGAWVEIPSSDGLPTPSDRQPTDADGRFRLAGLEAGAYCVIARLPRGLGPESRSIVPAIAEDVAAGRRGLELVLRRGEPIAGRVRNADGTGALRARVVARDPRGRVLHEAVCDADGCFEVFGPRDSSVDLMIVGADPDPSFNSSTMPSRLKVEDVRSGSENLEYELPSRSP